MVTAVIWISRDTDGLLLLLLFSLIFIPDTHANVAKAIVTETRVVKPVVFSSYYTRAYVSRRPYKRPEWQLWGVVAVDDPAER